MSNKFITGQELLDEMHRCKLSYCSYLEDWHADYDHIVNNLKEITPKLIEEVRLKKARPRGGVKVPVEAIDPETLVFRVMTFEHIPKMGDGKKSRSKGAAADYEMLPFPPRIT